MLLSIPWAESKFSVLSVCLLSLGGLTLPTLFHKPSSIPRGGEFRGIFYAIIIFTRATEQSFLLLSEEQTAGVDPVV